MYKINQWLAKHHGWFTVTEVVDAMQAPNEKIRLSYYLLVIERVSLRKRFDKRTNEGKTEYRLERRQLATLTPAPPSRRYSAYRELPSKPEQKGETVEEFLARNGKIEKL